ncbi:hypothetical protein CerSpe_278630 [Prunus speciosa]
MGSICGNNADWLMHDEEWQSFDTELKERTTRVIDSLCSSGAISTEYLNYVVLYVRDWNQKAGELILVLQRDVEGEGRKGRKGKQSQRRKKKNSRFQNVVDEFEDNSGEMLDLLSELDKFVTSASNSHSSIKTVVLGHFDKQEKLTPDHYKKIAEKLKDLKAGIDNPHSAQILLQKVERLLNMHKQLLDKLNVEKSKLAKKQQTAGTWKKVVNMLYIASGAAILLCNMAAAVLASPSVVATVTISAALAGAAGGLIAGQQWTASFVTQYQARLKADENLVDAMIKNTRAARKGLNNIKHLIDRVVNEIDSLLGQSDFAIAEEHINVTMKDIQKKLESFMNKIEGLKGEVDKCRTELMKTRDDVVKAGSALL